MPQSSFLRKSLKTVCIDTVLFFAIFAVVGHLTINFWERYTIQNELSIMKSSLHTLKDTITNIGKAYDNLHVELKDLFNIVNRKQTKMIAPPQCIQRKEPEVVRCKNKYNIDRTDHRILQDIQVQTVVTKPNKMKVGVGVATDKYECRRENKTTGPFLKNATTNTKNPAKSTGISSDMSNYEKELCFKNDSRRIHSLHNYLRCYKDFEHCRHCHHSKDRVINISTN